MLPIALIAYLALIASCLLWKLPIPAPALALARLRFGDTSAP